MSLSDRVAIIGAAAGIGAGIASVLAERRARIAIVQPMLAQAKKAAHRLPDAAGFAAGPITCTHGDGNLKRTIWCSQALATHMIAIAGSSIVHIASVGAYAAQEVASVYCASRAAQVSLAHWMAIELAPHGIRCCRCYALLDKLACLPARFFWSFCMASLIPVSSLQ